MSDFLLELRCEEIPARMQAGARAELEKLFRKEMDVAGVSVGEVTVWSTPRRLALIARGLPETTEAVREETKGPRTSAPEQALAGFLRKTGLAKDQLEDRDGVFYAVVERPGRATRDVLAEAIPAIVRAFSWPKSMRWGAASLSTESVRWVRPLSGIVAILGEDLVECEVGGVQSGYATLGHRFHHDGLITIGGADDYQEKLRACHVIVDHAERQDLIRAGAKTAAEAEGLTLVEDEGLVIENAGLTEWPVPLLGRFDAAFLDVPPEVIQLTARTNQKYFVCIQSSPERGGGPAAEQTVEGAPSVTSPGGAAPPPRSGEATRLANAFVCTANIDPVDGGAGVIDGNRKVLAARLSDARFFWEQDRKTPLAEHANKLERITFHEKLGTVADKVERVAKLARWLVEEGIIQSSPSLTGRGTSEAGGGVSSSAVKLTPPPSSGRSPSPSRLGEDRANLADLAEQAARLAKADLVTEMVGEFPELQGVMGGYYARAEGLPDAVADAIRDHYKPVGQGDEVPTAPVTVAVSLADKLDNLFSFFDVDLLPTGSKDPFALRRAALGYLQIAQKNELRPEFSALARAWGGKAKGILGLRVADFLFDRLGVQLRDDGIRHDYIQASRSWMAGSDTDGRVDRVEARARALASFLATEDGANLLAGYKRAANILKKEGWGGSAPLPQAGGAGGGPLSADGAPARGDSPTPDPSREREGGLNTQGIPRTGEEDPLAMVDDPDLAAVVQARVELDRAREKQLSYTPEPAESALIAALDSAEPTASAAVEAEDFGGAMAALASLRAPIDAFFDNVTVNDADPARREARLSLLARFRDAVHRVADFSRIEG